METKIIRTGVFLVHSTEIAIGGVETHQYYFTDYYFNTTYSGSVSFKVIMENSNSEYTLHWLDNKLFKHKYIFKHLTDIANFISKNCKGELIFFLNDPWWIEDIPYLRIVFPKSLILMRTGGNDIEYAPWHIGNFSYTKRRNLWRNNINLLDFIIANSNFTVERLIRLGVLKNKIIKIRGGVDSNAAFALLKEKRGIRTRIVRDLKISQKYVIAFASRWVPFKGMKEALYAFMKSERKHDTHILLIGDGELANEIHDWVYENLDESQFSLVGKICNIEVLKYLAGSDLTVNGSIEYLKRSGDGFYTHTETMGRTMMESICVGTPILATNVGGTPELFDECEHIGMMVSPQIKSLVQGFNQLPNILGKKVSFAPDYSWHHVFNSYEKLFTMKP